MAYYNHFSIEKYEMVLFDDLAIGDKFRNDFFTKGRRRKDIICIKTGKLTYIEKRSGKEHSFVDSKGYGVRSFDKLYQPF